MQAAVEIINAYAHSNDPPSDFERTRISQLLNEEDIALVSLDAEIAELKAKLAALGSLRRKRRKIVKKLRAITSPLRLLPPEIVSLIFTNCLRDGTDGTIENPDPLLAPLLLVQICSRWRKIAMDTPSIWTEMQLVLLDRPPRKMEVLSQWVENASPFPISLAAECHASHELLHILHHIRRFKILHLRFFPGPLSIFGPHCDDVLDAESLQVDLHLSRRRGLHTVPIYSAFASSPSLRSFRFVSDSSANLSLFSLPWSQLTELHITTESAAFSAMEVLMQCTSLVHCTLGTLVSLGEHLSHATFPFLTNAQFIFEVCNQETMEEFFRPLTFPSLEHIMFESTYDTCPWPQMPFADLQLRSSFKLESLHFDGVYFERPEDLGRVIENLPSLKSLGITSLETSEAVVVMKALTWDGSNSFLPQLKRLKIGHLQGDSSIKPYIAMLESRLKEGPSFPVSHLKFVWLESDEETDRLDRWWWEWKLPHVFPTVEWKFTVRGGDDD